MAPLTPSWISWLEDQQLANSAPQDAMLGDPFQPGVGEVFRLTLTCWLLLWYMWYTLMIMTSEFTWSPEDHA
jgi:hypothetical protein